MQNTHRIPLAALTFFLMSFTSPCAFSQSNTLVELLATNELRFEKRVPRNAEKGTLIILEHVRPKYQGIKRGFLSERARRKLLFSGIRSKTHSLNFVKALKRGKLRPNKALSPKLVIEAIIIKRPSDFTYTVKCFLYYLEYKAQNKGRTAFKTSIWRKSSYSTAVPKDSIDGNLSEFINTAVSELISERKLKKTFATQKKKKSRRVRHSPYNLKWHDLDERRGKFNIGGLVGTPTLISLQLGYWGTRAFPIVVDLSGMYISSEQRGAQLDLAWAFDNQGKTKQTAGISLLFANDTTTDVQETKDAFGRTTQVRTETFQALNAYLGPTYTLNWGNFKLQAGAGLRKTGGGLNIRPIARVGYTVPLNF